MTIASLKRKYPKLLRQVERSSHSKFKKRPTLKIVQRIRRPKNHAKIVWKGKQVYKVKEAQIFISKRMAQNQKLAELMLLHELRENLAFQNGQSKTKGHRIAARSERRYREKLGVDKPSGWLLRVYGYGR